MYCNLGEYLLTTLSRIIPDGLEPIKILFRREIGEAMKNTLGQKGLQINDLEIVENIDILFENEVIIYGAGTCGKKICKNLKIAGLSVSYFCDGDNNKWGQIINDIGVISPDDLKRLDAEKNLIVIIASYNVPVTEQIISDIAELKLKTNKIYTEFALKFSLIRNSGDYRISEAYRSLCNLYFSAIESKHTFIHTSRAICFFDNTDSDILIYQPGKVGSSTVYKSLTEIDIACTQLHVLNFWNKKTSNTYNKIFKKTALLKIITLVREPISRDISRVFEQLNYIAHLMHESSFLDLCIEFLMRTKPMIPLLFDIKQFDWFDDELKAVFGIDIYAHPFDKEKGYSIIKQGNIEVLAMKLEKLNSLESVIGEFVGAPKFKLINDREGDTKWYRYLYKNVKDTIKIPKEVLDQYYENNPKMDHFYSKKEKIAFLKKWEKNIIAC